MHPTRVLVFIAARLAAGDLLRGDFAAPLGHSFVAVVVHMFARQCLDHFDFSRPRDFLNLSRHWRRWRCRIGFPRERATGNPLGFLGSGNVQHGGGENLSRKPQILRSTRLLIGEKILESGLSDFLRVFSVESLAASVA